MGKCHVISAKRMGWEQMYDYYTFPVNEYSREEAMDQFRTVEKETKKIMGNGIRTLHMNIMEKYIILLFILGLQMKANLINKLYYLLAKYMKFINFLLSS
ncbi:hypothetical protein ACQPVP_02495 [Clostridium nigeriense]|uniref:hypothetical protein n=1 Tax=Clostridium nigeriense TaxID=1805470 RepID=UPI003D3549D6